MQLRVGIPSPMAITARHFANRAPSCRYSANRSLNPSKPSVIFSPGKFARASGGKQDFTIHSPILLRRRDIDTFQALLDRSRTFIGCENPLSRRDQFSCYGFQIFSFHNCLLFVERNSSLLPRKILVEMQMKTGWCGVGCLRGKFRGTPS